MNNFCKVIDDENSKQTAGGTHFNMLRSSTYEKIILYLNCKFIIRDSTYSEHDNRKCIVDSPNNSRLNFYLAYKLCWNVSTWEKSPISLVNSVYFTKKFIVIADFYLQRSSFAYFQMIDSYGNCLLREYFIILWMTTFTRTWIWQ